MNANQPRRIRRQRTRGFRLPANTICVSRPNLRYGNPFVHDDPAIAVLRYRDWITNPHRTAVPHDGRWYYATDNDIAELAGKNLACWCPLTQPDGEPHPCHANILLTLANPQTTRRTA